MANVKITDLGAYTDPVSTDVLPIVDVGADVTKKVSIADLMENAGSGTASAPGIAFDGDSDTGIYRPGANQVAISTNGTGRLFVDASGNVGVGAPSSFNFGVTGANSTAGTIRVQGGSGANTNAVLDLTGRGSDNTYTNCEIRSLGAGSGSGGTLAFLTDSTGAVITERMRIDSSGRVGIGTPSPAVACDVVGKVRASTGILFGSDTANANTLDDYEEGTWTVIIYDALSGGNASASTGTGYYTKIGRCVSCVFTNISNINTTGMTAGNIVYVSLPFASTIGVSSGGSIFIEGMTLPSSNTNVMPVVAGNSGRFMLYAGGASGGPRTAIRVQDLTSGTTDFRYFELTYFI